VVEHVSLTLASDASGPASTSGIGVLELAGFRLTETRDERFYYAKGSRRTFTLL